MRTRNTASTEACTPASTMAAAAWRCANWTRCLKQSYNVSSRSKITVVIRGRAAPPAPVRFRPREDDFGFRLVERRDRLAFIFVDLEKVQQANDLECLHG